MRGSPWHFVVRLSSGKLGDCHFGPSSFVFCPRRRHGSSRRGFVGLSPGKLGNCHLQAMLVRSRSPWGAREPSAIFWCIGLPLSVSVLAGALEPSAIFVEAVRGQVWRLIPWDYLFRFLSLYWAWEPSAISVGLS